MTRSKKLLAALRKDGAAYRLIQQEYGIRWQGMTMLRNNFNFVFGSKELILRFSPAFKKPSTELQAELKWTAFLAARGFFVNEVVLTQSGKAYLEIPVGEELLYAVCFVRSPATAPQAEDYGPDLYRKLGDLLGRMHLASREFAPDASFPHWYEQSKTAAFPVLPDDERQLPQLLAKLNQRFAALPRPPEEYGVIHYDVHQGNYFLLRDQPQIPIFLFDFELTCQGWYLQDIAVVLYYLSNRNALVGKTPRAVFEADFLLHFQEAYEQHLPDITFDAELIQAHLLYRDLFVYAFVLDAWSGRLGLDESQQRFLHLLENNLAERSANYAIRTTRG
ncbi:MAG: phosphotransferase [Bacteroidota bacterium]